MNTAIENNIALITKTINASGADELEYDVAGFETLDGSDATELRYGKGGVEYVATYGDATRRWTVEAQTPLFSCEGMDKWVTAEEIVAYGGDVYVYTLSDYDGSETGGAITADRIDDRELLMPSTMPEAARKASIRADMLLGFDIETVDGERLAWEVYANWANW